MPRNANNSAAKVHTQSVHGKMRAVDRFQTTGHHRGDFEKMARRRFQQPQPRKEGNFWYLRIWDAGLAGNRKRQRIKLAPATTPLREVQKIAAEKLRPVNQGLVTATSAVNFTTFVQSEYIAALPLGLSRPTENSYRGCISKYLEPAFGNLSLRELTPSLVQQYFSKLGGQIAHPTILKIRDALSSVLRYACENDFLVKNPLEHLRLPKDKRPKGPKPTITVEEFNRLVAAIREPYASAVFVSGLTGLRVSELLALRWRSIDRQQNSIRISERFYRGDYSTPKTAASAAVVSVHPDVIRRLDRLKTLRIQVRAGRTVRNFAAVKSRRGKCLIFQSVETGAAMNDQNILKRHIQPAARRSRAQQKSRLANAPTFILYLADFSGRGSEKQGLIERPHACKRRGRLCSNNRWRTIEAIEKLAAFGKLSSGPIAGPELVQ